MRLEARRREGDLAAELDIVFWRVEVDGVINDRLGPRKELRRDARLARDQRWTVDAQVEAVGRVTHILRQVMEPQTVHHVLGDDPALVGHDAVRPAIFVDLVGLGRDVLRPQQLLIVVRVANIQSVVIVEPVIDLGIEHVIVTAGWKRPILSGGKRIGRGQRDDLDGVDLAEFIRAEEVRPVDRQRTADRSTIALLLERGLLFGEIVRGIERAIPPEIEPAAAELISPSLAHHGDDSAQRAPVLRIELIAEHLELLHGLLCKVHRRASPDRIVDVTTVDQRGKAVALVGHAAELRRVEVLHPAIVGSRPRQELRELQEVAPEVRKRVHLLGQDH